MFGESKKTVLLTTSEVQMLMAGMDRKQKKEFAKRQRKAENERFFDALLLAEALDDD